MVLCLLSESDLYGYQIVQAIAERSEGIIQVQIGTLYPVLYKLTEEGYISDTEVSVGKRRVRIYYHLEKSGKLLLDNLLSEYLAFEHGLEKVLAAYTPSNKEDKEDG